VNRLTAVKQVFRDFAAGEGELPGRPNDLIGLIAFGGYADSKCPLTLDHDVLLKTLAGVEIPQPVRDTRGRTLNARYLDEEMATAIGDAVTLAADRLRQSEAKSKVVILLSDGANNAGVVDPAQAAEAAKALGIKIYTIGVGTTGLAPYPIIDPFGRRRLIMQRLELDETTLKMMAEKTGGHYFHAKNTEALQEVYAEIDKLEKTVSEGKIYADYREFYQYAMFPGLGLVLLEVLLVATRFRSLP
jgi:Ca-activated chloride channel family protein